MKPRILPVGDQALTVEFGQTIDPLVNAHVRALDENLLEDPLPGQIETIPSYCALLVLIRPGALAYREAVALLEERVAQLRPRAAEDGPLRRVPTLYGGQAGPDLAAVAGQHSLTPEEVVRLHSQSEYVVYMLGFSPGFAFMGQLPVELDTPRRATPRLRVPPGSVGMAGRQTGVYPQATPGGWQIIGRTPLKLFNPQSEPPTYFKPGDRVRFEPIGAAEWDEPARQTSPDSTEVSDSYIEVVEAGLLTTVQDSGRAGYQRLGVPPSGALDAEAHAAANRLLDNAPQSATLECTLVGPRLRFASTTAVALAGADLGARLEGPDLQSMSVPPGLSVLARAGSTLSFGPRRAGCRVYLAVAGGIVVPPVLGSRSTALAGAFGGHAGRPLQAGDRLPIAATHSPARLAGRRAAPGQTGQHAVVRVILGPQADSFTSEAIDTLLSAIYAVSASSDRMGLRLHGPALEHAGPKEIVSDATMPGSIQVPGDGHPIILLADRQTVGGYPKIATVVSPDLPRLAQLVPGEATLRFEAVAVKAAWTRSFD